MSHVAPPTRGRIAASLLGAALVSAASLAFGGRHLEILLPGGLPVGNALAAIMLGAAAGAAILFARRGSHLRALSWIALAAALAWLPVSVLLAGNAALVFGNGRGDVWTVLTLCTLGLVALSLMLAVATASWAFLKGERPA